MRMIEHFVKQGITIENDYGETVRSQITNGGYVKIVFDNGLCVSIIENKGDRDFSEKYSVAVCDYQGYFIWEFFNDTIFAQEPYKPLYFYEEMSVVAIIQYVQHFKR